MTAHRMISERDRVIVDQAGRIRDLQRDVDILKARVESFERALATPDDLMQYVDAAKAACGDERVSGEPLADFIMRIMRDLRSMRDMLTAEQLEEWRHR